MTVKEQLLHSLDQLPEAMLYKVLEFVESLQAVEHSMNEETDNEDEVWQAYLASEQERQKVYRVLPTPKFIAIEVVAGQVHDVPLLETGDPKCYC